jgi:putative salt-induced outer membrane protein YdiY
MILLDGNNHYFIEGIGMRLKTGFGLLALMLCVSAVMADRIVLSNGDQITGRVLSYEKQVVEFESSLLGRLKIKTADIKSLEINDSVPIVLREDQEKLQKAKLTATQNEIKLEGDTGARQVLWDAIVALGSAAEKLNAPLDDKFKWSGNASAGFSGYTGNVNFAMMNSNAVIQAANPDWVFNGYVNNYYAEQEVNGENNRIGNLIRGGLGAKRLLMDGYSLFAALDEEKNEFAKLSFRNLFSSGVGKKWFSDERWSFETRVGGGHQYEQFSTGESRNFGVGTLGSDVSYKITDRMDLSQKTSWYPRVDNEEDYRIVAESAATVYFDQTKRWFVKTGLKHEYDNKPAADKLERLDMYYFTNLGLSF